MLITGYTNCCSLYIAYGLDGMTVESGVKALKTYTHKAITATTSKAQDKAGVGEVLINLGFTKVGSFKSGHGDVYSPCSLWLREQNAPLPKPSEPVAVVAEVPKTPATYPGAMHNACIGEFTTEQPKNLNEVARAFLPMHHALPYGLGTPAPRRRVVRPRDINGKFAKANA